MDSDDPAIKKLKLEEKACSCADQPTPSDQPTAHMTQVFLIPKITKCKDLSNVETKLNGSSTLESPDSVVTQSIYLVPKITKYKDLSNVETKLNGSSILESTDSVVTQSIYLDEETDDTFNEEEEEKPKFGSAEKLHIGLSDVKTRYGKRSFEESVSSEDGLPIPKKISSVLSEKESGNESGYSSTSASYVKCQPLEKSVESLLDSTEQLVDVENLEMKQNCSSDELGSISSEKKMRFLRTASALHRSGLMEITIKTADILKQNRIVSREIERLHQDTLKFLQSVIKNPENKTFQEMIIKNSNNPS